jgi:hypothetical protein
MGEIPFADPDEAEEGTKAELSATGKDWTDVLIGNADVWIGMFSAKAARRQPIKRAASGGIQ